MTRVLAATAAGPLGVTAAARDTWLADAAVVLEVDPRVVGAVVVGSLARGDADVFSDVDLIVAIKPPLPEVMRADPFAGLGLPGELLYQRPKPRNAPGRGAYLAACLNMEGLPVLVDLYLWPADTAAVPTGGRVLFEKAPLPRSDQGLLALLQHTATDATGSDPQDPATVLLQVQLAAKYHARGDQARRAAMCRQLHSDDITSTGQLRQLLDCRLAALRPAPSPAVVAVGQLLTLIDVNKESTVSSNPVGQQITPGAARRQLVDRLTSRGWITRPEVAAAFQAVPRHLFTPDGTSVETAYADDVVVTQRRPDGPATSSISAPWLQAYMVETARLRPGSRVLEIGSGGYNAALLAEIVGPTGSVVSVDIDEEVVAAARFALNRAGYPQVQVVHGDGEFGYPAGGPYDAVIVTVEAADIPPAWTDQLAADGMLVVPLRMRGNVRCLTLKPADDHLVAVASLQCGFVPMQGAGRDRGRRLALRGDDAVLVVDDPTTEVDLDALRVALDQPRFEAWLPQPVPMSQSFEALHMWLASQPRPYGVMVVNRERTTGLLDPQDKFFCPTLLTVDSLAYLTLRRHDETSWQLGAHSFGPNAAPLATDLITLVATWNEQHRADRSPQITIHPPGTVLPDTDQLRLLLPRPHRLIAVTWPRTSR